MANAEFAQSYKVQLNTFFLSNYYQPCKYVVMPEYNSQIGNPVILPRNYFNTLKSLKDDFGARSLIRKKDIITLKSEFGTIFDIDTKDELAKTYN